MSKDTKKEKKRKREGKGFFKDFKAELKKVVWPTPKQLAKTTSVVIGMILVTAAIVFCLDFVFDKGYTFVFDKAQSTIKSIESKNNTNTTKSNENAVENATEGAEEGENSTNTATEE